MPKALRSPASQAKLNAQRKVRALVRMEDGCSRAGVRMERPMCADAATAMPLAFIAPWPISLQPPTQPRGPPALRTSTTHLCLCTRTSPMPLLRGQLRILLHARRAGRVEHPEACRQRPPNDLTAGLLAQTMPTLVSAVIWGIAPGTCVQLGGPNPDLPHLTSVDARPGATS
jgi:hypothetical protein